MAADDRFHRVLGTDFDPCVEDRRPLHPLSLLIGSDVGAVSDRPGGLQQMSILHIPQSRKPVVVKVYDKGGGDGGLDTHTHSRATFFFQVCSLLLQHDY